MALSAELGRADMSAERVETVANLTMEKSEPGWTTTGIVLDVSARVPGADEARFKEVAEAAKENCPVSRLLDTKITMTARLV